MCEKSRALLPEEYCERPLRRYPELLIPARPDARAREECQYISILLRPERSGPREVV
jgi:hypothetical protein